MEAEELSREYILNAKQLVKNGSFSKAFDLFLLAFNMNRRLRRAHQNEFRETLTSLNEVLAAAGKTEDIFHNFGRALKAYPDNIYLLNDTGKYLYKYGFYNEAMYHFEKAVMRNSFFVNAEKNMNSIKNLLVERWHYRMLNDNVRNFAFCDAIHDTLIPWRERVLDIGTGTGLLAIYASKCIPEAVIGCDGSEVMAMTAQSVALQNHLPKLMIINKMSTEMDSDDMFGKCSLVVTELFDAGLFGEHVLQTLSHAWENLISSPGKVIPYKAEFFVIGADCDHLHRKYQLCSSTKTLLNITSLNVHVITNDETYDSEDVHLIKDIKYMTEPQSLLKVYFNNLKDINEKLNRTEPYDLKFKCKENGEINVFIGWFNLYLSHRYSLTTDPRSSKRANAWQQAVFFDNIQRSVIKKETFHVEFLLNHGKLTMLPDNDGDIIRISTEALRFLNDIEYIKMINGCIPMACVYLGQIAEMPQICVADLCPFPLFGLMMLKRGVQSLVCCARTENDKTFFEKVFEENQIPLSRVTILLENDWTPSIFGEDKFHAVFCNIFELCGDIDLHQKQIALQMQQTYLLQGGLFMPVKMMTVCQLVDSNWLAINNSVKNNDYSIASYMCMYEVTQNFCIDFGVLDYDAISDPVVIGPCTSEDRYDVVDVTIVNTGLPNAILCWYKIELMEQYEDFTTKRSNCFIDGTVFLTGLKEPLLRNQTVRIARYTDRDGSFKLKIEGPT